MGNDLREPGALQALVIADGAPGDGLGHLSRSGAVARALGALGLRVRCLALGAEAGFHRDGMDWDPAPYRPQSLPLPESRGVIVFDSYRAAPPSSGTGLVLCAMHDRFALPAGAICVAVGRPAGTAGKGGVEMLAGPRFACLRPDFWDIEPGPIRASPDVVLVSTGAGEGAGSAVELAADLASAVPGLAVRAVRGPQAAGGSARAPGVEVIEAPASLRDQLLEADIAVLAGGQTMLEALACGVPTVAMPLVENQRAQTRRLADEGAVVLAENPWTARRRLSQLVGSIERRRDLSTRARHTVDGEGACRVARRILERLS